MQSPNKNIIKTRVAVIGAGITGCAIARELSRYSGSIMVIDKEADVGWGTTKANTGLIHPGYAGEEGTLRLSLSCKGKQLFVKNAEELSIPVKLTSSILNAFNAEHVHNLEKLLEQGRRYGVPGLKIISNRDGSLRKIEPNISDNVIAALYCREHFATSPYEAATALYENATINGINFLLSSEVRSIDFNESTKKFYLHIRNTSGAEEFLVDADTEQEIIVEAEWVVNAAGVFSDEIALMIGDESFSITAIKGQYFLLDSEVEGLIRMQNFRLPDKENIRSKGMVVGITTGGNFLVGSNYTKADKYDISTAKTDLDEIKDKLSAMIKNIPFDRVITTFAGLRAYADTGDFVLGPSSKNNRFINAAGIQSPGLTCAFIIAEMIVDYLKESGLKLVKNRKFIPERRPPVKLDRVDFLSNDKLHKKDKSFGEIICRCEKVSKAEVIAAIRGGATTLDGIKFRTRAGMGRCQGGYCTLRIMKILAVELGIPYEQIKKSGFNSNMVGYRMT
jgi:glycerol-3-phosphate dehydrogenase